MCFVPQVIKAAPQKDGKFKSTNDIFEDDSSFESTDSEYNPDDYSDQDIGSADDEVPNVFKDINSVLGFSKRRPSHGTLEDKLGEEHENKSEEPSEDMEDQLRYGFSKRINVPTSPSDDGLRVEQLFKKNGGNDSTSFSLQSNPLQEKISKKASTRMTPAQVRERQTRMTPAQVRDRQAISRLKTQRNLSAGLSSRNLSAGLSSTGNQASSRFVEEDAAPVNLSLNRKPTGQRTITAAKLRERKEISELQKKKAKRRQKKNR